MDCQPAVTLAWNPAQFTRGLYRKLLFTRRPGLSAGATLPSIQCAATAVVDTEKLDAYRALCALESASALPLLYPYVMMGGAHLLILSHDRFPLRSLGLLHLRNHIVQWQAIPVDADLQLTCGIRRQRITEKGLEFDIDSEVKVANQLVWQCVSTLLKLGKFGQPEQPSPLADLFPPVADASSRFTFQVPSNMGRQYAKVSGDHNPIHTSRLAAKLFGFKSSIAHGMWTVARCLGSLDVDTLGACRLDVAFKGPVFLGSTVEVKQQGERIDLYCGRNPRPVVNARLVTDAAKLPEIGNW